MSLTAQIRIDSSRPLLACLTCAAGGGCLLTVSTIAARLRAGESIVFLAGLLALSVIGIALFFRRLRDSTCVGCRRLSVSAEGLIEVEQIGTADRVQASGPHEEGRRYRLAADSLAWPGFYVLRLSPTEELSDVFAVGAAAGRATRLKAMVLIAFGFGVSESDRRSLARLLFWAQRKGVSPPAAPIAPSSAARALGDEAVE